MRKYITIFILVLSILSLAACSSGKPYSPSSEALDLSLFVLPDGFVLEQESSTSAVIIGNDQIVGGITLTGLQSGCIHEKHHLSVQKYLDYIAPSPLIGEWIIMEGKEFLSVSMSITDSEKDIRSETTRKIFVKNGLVYDCWLYSNLSNENIDLILNSIIFA